MEQTPRSSENCYNICIIVLVLFNPLSCLFIFLLEDIWLETFFAPFLNEKFNNRKKALLSQLYCISPQLSPRSPEIVDMYSGTQGLVLTASTTWQLLLFSQNYGDKERQREPVVVSISKVKWHSRNLRVNKNRKETNLSSLGSLTWIHLEMSGDVIGGRKGT